MLIAPVLLFVILFILVLDIWQYSTGVVFLSRRYTQKLLKQDRDGYFDGLNMLDLRARNENSLKEYVEDSVSSATTVGLLKELEIEKLAREVDNDLDAYGLNVISKIKWKIAFTKHQIYEFGLPHTRLDVIFLDADEQIDKLTLCHEKLHVFEKLYPETFEIWLRETGFYKVGLRNNHRNIVANPDADKFVYAHVSDQTPMLKLYGRAEPDNIIEHPTELFAYTISKEIYSSE